MSGLSSSKTSRTVPREKAFYFFTSIGNYTGINAASLNEFLEKIRDVSIKSLEFHLSRGDFEKWIATTLEDKELAAWIRDLQNQRLTGDLLRMRLSLLVSRRLKQLSH